MRNDVMAETFTHLINISIQLRQFPGELKSGKLVLVHKKGDTSNYENYRHIVLLKYLSKIAEKLVSSNICKYSISDQQQRKEEALYC